MGVARKEVNFVGEGLDQNRAIDSLQHIYDQLQMIDHVLELQVDHAILDTFQRQNQQVNVAMIEKNIISYTQHNK